MNKLLLLLAFVMLPLMSSDNTMRKKKVAIVAKQTFQNSCIESSDNKKQNISLDSGTEKDTSKHSNKLNNTKGAENAKKCRKRRKTDIKFTLDTTQKTLEIVEKNQKKLHTLEESVNNIEKNQKIILEKLTLIAKTQDNIIDQIATLANPSHNTLFFNFEEELEQYQ